jgi:hypothetical protein
MQVFQDSYFSLLSTWVQVAIYLLVFFVALTPRLRLFPLSVSA